MHHYVFNLHNKINKITHLPISMQHAARLHNTGIMRIFKFPSNSEKSEAVSASVYFDIASGINPMG